MNSLLRRSVLPWILSLPVILAVGCGEKSTQPDLSLIYRPDNVGDYAYQLYVQPNWIGADGVFWYLKETSEKTIYQFIDPNSGISRPLFDHQEMALALSSVSTEAISAARINLESLSVAEDHDVISFTFQNTEYDYTISTQELAEKTDKENESQSEFLVTLKDHNLFVTNSESGEERWLTNDGTAERPYATPIVNPRSILEGNHDPSEADFTWSWDGDYIVTYQMELANISSFEMENEGDILQYAYPRSLDKSVPLATPVVFDVRNAEKKIIPVEPIPVLYYGAPYLTWVDDHEVLFTRVDRGYGARTVYNFDVSTNALNTVLTEESDSFVNIYDGTNWQIYDWDQLLWVSDLEGYSHISLTSLDGSGELKRLTGGDWRVVSIVNVDEEEGDIYFLGSGRQDGVDPYYRALYRVNKDGGDVEPLTEDKFDHSIFMSPNDAFFVDNISAVNQPTRSVVRQSSDGAIIMELGQADVSKFEQYGFVFPEPVKVMLDSGLDVYGVIYRPGNFDASKSYPVIEQVYTGPHTFNAAKSFNQGFKRSSAQSVANAGFIVLQIDAEGTEGRSRNFLEPAYKNLGDVGLDTRIEAIKKLAVRYPELDISRVGAFGFSAGGYDVVRMMTRRPGFYKVGVAASGNHDSRWDKAVWNEQWLGIDDPSVYDRNSNLAYADQLSGPLLLVHGKQDENVPYEATQILADAINDAGKGENLSVKYYPTGGHFLENKPEFHDLRIDFFKNHLGRPKKR